MFSISSSARGAPADGASGQLVILGAAYGLFDVTPTVSAADNRSATPQTLAIPVDNAEFPDGWVGAVKTLTVVYRYDSDVVRIATAAESGTLSISPNQTQLAPGVDTPSTSLTVLG